MDPLYIAFAVIALVVLFISCCYRMLPPRGRCPLEPRSLTPHGSYVESSSRQFEAPPSPPPPPPPPAVMYASYAQPNYSGEVVGGYADGPRNEEDCGHYARANELADALPVFEAGPKQAFLPCPICLGPLRDEQVTCADCLHLIHALCLRGWLVKDVALTCPVCREPLTRSHGQVRPV